MSQHVIAHLPRLQSLTKLTPRKRRDLLEKANLQFFKSIVECIENVMKGNIQLKKKCREKLLKYKTVLRRILHSGKKLKVKKEIIVQNGGAFLPALIDVDDDVTQPNIESPSYQPLQSDYNFTAPRMLSILDRSMNEILSCRDMDDSEKWLHYNQALQKFLNYMKKARVPSTHNIDVEQRNRTIDAFDGHISEPNITGVHPLRDSLESISQPSVRDFFQQLRENALNTSRAHQSSPVVSASTTANQHSLMSIDDLHTTPQAQPQLPRPLIEKQHTPRKTVTKKKRPAKRCATKAMSDARPTKKPTTNRITPRALFRQRHPAGSRHELYWEITAAK